MASVTCRLYAIVYKNSRSNHIDGAPYPKKNLNISIILPQYSVVNVLNKFIKNIFHFYEYFCCYITLKFDQIEMPTGH